MRSHAIETGSARHTGSKGIFIRILQALHLSRRDESMRTIRRYRHLTIVSPTSPVTQDETPVDRNVNDASTAVSARIREIRNMRKS